MKVFCEAFLYLQFGFVIYWQKNIGAKAAHKMLMKLTTGLNFTNIFQGVFFLTKALSGAFCTYNMWLYFLSKGHYGKKAALKILEKLTTGVNFTNIFKQPIHIKYFC